MPSTADTVAAERKTKAWEEGPPVDAVQEWDTLWPELQVCRPKVIPLCRRVPLRWQIVLMHEIRVGSRLDGAAG
jgi:hypothetical protein